MLNQIIIHHGRTANKFDIGLLAETLLFYSDVLLLLDRSSLIALIRALDEDTILRLVDELGLKISYHRNEFATVTISKNGFQVNNLADLTISKKNFTQIVSKSRKSYLVKKETIVM